jgi:hypothetical protein
VSISDDFVAVLFPGFLNLAVVVWADFMVSGRQGEFCNPLFFPPTAEKLQSITGFKASTERPKSAEATWQISASIWTWFFKISRTWLHSGQGSFKT